MEHVILTWSVANWITVLLMALLGWALLALIINFTYINKGMDYAN